MDLRDFLEAFPTVDDLKDVLFMLEEPRGGTKEVLISRILTAITPPMGILLLLRNDTLQDALRWAGVSPSGRKSELVVRLIESEVVTASTDEILAFLDSMSKTEFNEYHRLLLCTELAGQLQRAMLLLSKASASHLCVFAKLNRSAQKPNQTAKVLVAMLSRGSGDTPAFAAWLLEDMIEAAHTLYPVSSEIENQSDELMARQRRIRASFAGNPNLNHPAIDSLLGRIWSGEFSQKSSLLKDVREEVRSGTKRMEEAVHSLHEPTQARTLDEVRIRAARIDSRMENVQQGIRTIQDQLVAVRLIVEKHIEESPEKVADALGKLSQTKDVKWTTRRKIRKDLRRFWVLTDRLQKVEFLGRAVITYGPAVLAALKGLL